MLRFPFRKALFVVILASLMIPVQVVLVPFYRTMIALDLINTRIGLILAYTAFFLPFCVYLMTAFYSRLPRELVEAARMDGATLVQIWWNIMLPMGKPALLTLGILNTLYCWNDVLISLLVLQKERTVMVGIAALRGEYTTNVPLLCAGIALAAAPIVVIYVVFQRQIVNGIAVGAVKG
jgi:ABC-type glycerol-3-phosphate transport system permease component